MMGFGDDDARFRDHSIRMATEYARSLSNSGNREDFTSFKESVLRILDDHRARADEAYKRFMTDNKNKLIGSLETKWFLTLIDEKEVAGYQELFELHKSELDTLIQRHED